MSIKSEDYSKVIDDIKNEASGYSNMRRFGQMYNSPSNTGASAQGFTALDSEIAIQYFQNASGHDRQQGVLKKFNVRTGVVSLTKLIKGYHGNSLSYNRDDGYVYMAMAEDTSGMDTAQKTKLLKINPVDLSITSTIDLTDKTGLSIIHCVGYDSVDKLFVVADNNTMEFYDVNWNIKFTQKWSSLLGYTPGYMQGVQINGDKLYWIGGRKSQIWLYEIDADNQKISFNTQYTFDSFQENLYPTGEIQGLGFNGGEVYVTSNVSISSWVGLSQYFVTTSKFKIAASSPSLVPYVFAHATEVSFYVGDNTAYNPTGTKDNPFASLLEAETCMMSTDVFAKSLTLLNSKTEILVLSSLDHVTFNGNGYQVRAAVVTNCESLILNELETSSYSGYKNCATYIYNSNVTMKNYKSASLGSSASYELIMEESGVKLVGNDNTTRIHTIDSKLFLTAPTKLITKDNDRGLVIGDFAAGSFTNISSPADLNMATMLHYNRVKAVAVVNIDGKSLGFRVESLINKSVTTANLSGYTISSDVIYFIMIHYVRATPTYSTIEVFKMPDFSSVAISSYSVEMYLTDN